MSTMTVSNSDVAPVEFSIPLKNAVWLQYKNVADLALREYYETVSGLTGLTNKAPNWGNWIARRCLSKVEKEISAILMKAGDFSNHDVSFQAVRQELLEAFDVLDEGIREGTADFQLRSADYRSSQEQHGAAKYLAFGALGVVAGVGTFLSEVGKDHQTNRVIRQQESHLLEEVKGYLRGLGEALADLMMTYYALLVDELEVLPFATMTQAHADAAYIVKHLDNIDDPNLQFAAIKKAAATFPFQGDEWLQKLLDVDVSYEKKILLVKQIEPYYQGDPDALPLMQYGLLVKMGKQAMANELVEKYDLAQKFDLSSIDQSSHTNPSDTTHTNSVRAAFDDFQTNATVKLWIYPDLNDKKIDAFIRAMSNGHEVDCQSVVAFYDDTLFGKADNGILITEETFYYRELGGNGFSIKLKNLQAISISGFINKTLKLTTPQGTFSASTTGDAQPAKVIYEALTYYINHR